MDWGLLARKAATTGVLCSLMYHMTLLVMGQQVSIAKVVLFTVVFVAVYFVWLMMAGLGRKQ